MLLAALLGACSVREARVAPATDPFVAQAAREQALRGEAQWSLRGKIAVTDGRDGGSGRIDWTQRGEDFVIEIRAPVSRRTWRLTRSEAGAQLEGLEDGVRHGADAEQLLHDAVGWSVPIADLVAWARGARGEGDAKIEFDADQRPARLEQHGWTVEYRAWDDREPALPTKVFAAQGQRRVRLVVEQWDRGR
jgi:outer membrane lipoprotein LolB